MTTVTTTTVSSAPSSGHAPTVAAPAAPAQTAYAPVVPQAPAQAPVVASSYTTGSSLPQVALPQVAEVGGSKKPLDSSIHQPDGYHTLLGDYFRSRGEFEYDCYLRALRMRTPILDKARVKLNLAVGSDLSQAELEFFQIFKKKQLKKFKNEIVRLVEEQKAHAMLTQAAPVYAESAAPAVAVPGATPAAVSIPAGFEPKSVPAATLPQIVPSSIPAAPLQRCVPRSIPAAPLQQIV